MDKPLCENLQNIDMNMFVSAAEVEISGLVQKKNHILRKGHLELCYNWNLHTQIEKGQKKQYLQMDFGCFLSTSLKQHLMKIQIAQNLKIDWGMADCL